MKKILAVALVVVVLAALGVAAYRLGWLNRVAAVAGIAPVQGGDPGAATGQAGSSPAPGAPAAADQPPTVPVKVAQTGEPAVNQAIELRVSGVRTAASIGERTPAAGRQFVIVDTAWKNLLEPQRVNRKAAADRTRGAGALGFGGGTGAEQQAENEANTTLESVRFQVDQVPEHVWLIVDGKMAEAIDTDATGAVDGHLPTDSLEIARSQEVRSGSFVFQAPANAQAFSLLFLDSIHGHVLVAAKGPAPQPVGALGGGARGNDVAQFGVTATSWAEAAGQPGMRTLLLTVRGISRKDAIAELPFGDYGFLQTDEGCIAQPEQNADAAGHSFAPVARLLPIVPREGQLAFIVPASTRAATLMFRPSGTAPVDVAALGNTPPQKPAVRGTFQDGSVLKVSVVGFTAPEANAIVVDYLVENLQGGQGLELQPDPQFNVVDDGGQAYAPDADSFKLPCRLTGANVVPAGGWRRFSLRYPVPAGKPVTLKYRGFEQEGALKIR